MAKTKMNDISKIKDRLKEFFEEAVSGLAIWAFGKPKLAPIKIKSRNRKY